MRILQPLFLLLLLGCATTHSPPLSVVKITTPKKFKQWSPPMPAEITTPKGFKYWQPSGTEKQHADELGRYYARHALGLSATQLAFMESQIFGAYREGGHPILHVGIFDRRFMTGPADAGGFPESFMITIDPIKWIVIDHYASTM